MEGLEKRIIAACDTNTMVKLEKAWGTTEDCLPSECVRARKMIKTEVSIFFGAIVLLVSLICTILMASIDREVVPLSLSTRMVLTSLFVTIIIFVTWTLCWPRPSRNPCWRTADDFADAIGYAEKATGQQFVKWRLDDASVETAVEKALVLELEAIFALQEKDQIKAGDLFAKWRRRHEQMQRLFPSIPEKTFYSRDVGLRSYPQRWKSMDDW